MRHVPEPLIFVRHGETDWNVEGRLQGQRDIPLNDIGRGQAERNGRELAAFFAKRRIEPASVAYAASPLSRARDTMDLVRRELGLPAGGYELDDRLKELTFGDWEGFTIPELAERVPDLTARRKVDKWGFVPPGGESYKMLSTRIEAWLALLDRPTVVVSHGGVMRVLRGLLLGLPETEIPSLDVPQDKVFVWADGEAFWL